MNIVHQCHLRKQATRCWRQPSSQIPIAKGSPGADDITQLLKALDAQVW